VSIRNFLAEVLSDTRQIDMWMNRGWWPDPGEPPPRETLIKQSWHTSPLEKEVLLTDSDLLISMRVLLFEPPGGGFWPQKRGKEGPMFPP
jgi:hypothetical protein